MELPKNHAIPDCAIRARSVRARRAFTLLELTITIAVIAILMGVLLPALGTGMEYARGFRCQMNLRSIAFDFNIFADEGLHGNRGDDEGQPNFALETFVENQYGVSEFWAWGNSPMVTRQVKDDPMSCSEVSGPLTMRKDVPCTQGAISPTQNVSFTFNGRLRLAETMGPRGRPSAKSVRLNSSILQQQRLPLVWDLDGKAAGAVDALPHFNAPPLDSASVYADDSQWFPSFRHADKGNFALIDGSVHASKVPLEEGWNWGYQAGSQK